MQELLYDHRDTIKHEFLLQSISETLDVLSAILQFLYIFVQRCRSVSARNSKAIASSEYLDSLGLSYDPLGLILTVQFEAFTFLSNT